MASQWEGMAASRRVLFRPPRLLAPSLDHPPSLSPSSSNTSPSIRPSPPVALAPGALVHAHPRDAAAAAAPPSGGARAVVPRQVDRQEVVGDEAAREQLGEQALSERREVGRAAAAVLPLCVFSRGRGWVFSWAARVRARRRLGWKEHDTRGKAGG